MTQRFSFYFRFYQCLCSTKEPSCDFIFELTPNMTCPRFPYCYQVISVTKTDLSDETIDADSKVFLCEARLAALNVSCRWQGINKETCFALSHFERPNNCRGCTNICWVGSSSVSYEMTGDRNKPEAGECGSPRTTPPLSSKISQTAAADGSSLNPSSTTTEVSASKLLTSTEFSSLQPSTTKDYPSLQPSTPTDFSSLQPSTPTDFSSLQPSTRTDFPSFQPSTTTGFSSLQPSTADAPYPTASVTTDVYLPIEPVNVSNGDTSGIQSHDNGNGNLVAIGIGLACAILIALFIAFSLVLFRRHRQRKSKEEAEKRRISYIQPYALSGQDYDGGAHANNNLFSSCAGDQFDFAKDEHDYRTYDALGNTYTDIADGDVASPGPSDKSKSDIDDYEFVNEENFSKSPYNNVEGRALCARVGGGTKGDNTYNKFNNGIVQSSPDFLDNVPETYHMTSTGKNGMDEGGKGHKKLRGGAGLSKESVRGDDLEMYRMTSAKELDTAPREEKEEAGHVYNRLRDGAGTSKGVVERDFEIYNVAAGKFKPHSENQTEKVVSNSPEEPVNPYSVASIIDNDLVVSSLEVKDGAGGSVGEEDRDDEGQGLSPSRKPKSGFTDSEDSRDAESTEYFVLENDKPRDTADKAGPTTHGLETSPEKQSTECFLPGNGTEKGATGEVIDTSLGDHTQTEYFMLEEKEGNVNGIARSSSLSVDGEKNLYFLTENEHKETEYFALEDEAKQANGDVGNHNLPKDGLGNLYFLTDNEQEETEYSLAEEDVVKDGGYDLRQSQPMDGLVSFDLTGDGSGLEGDYFMVDGDVGTDDKLHGSDADNNTDRREGGARGNLDSGIRISHVYNEIPGDEDETEYMEINDVVK